MVTIGVDQLLSNIDLYENIYLEKLISHTHILENVMINRNINIFFKQTWSPLLIDSLKTVQCHLFLKRIKKSSARKKLNQFYEVLDVKPKTAVRKLGAAKSKIKDTRAGSMLWYITPKRHVNTNINDWVKKALYNWIIQNPKVLQPPITNYLL